ncbi:MAG: ABC-2 family transporter protein [Deltaproteobacteria bacterium]|nr:ABC-2 family transporter protein [Deltaproteobacteria bacterium]
MQYRLDFLIDLGLAILATSSALVPLLVLYGDRQTVAGWTWPQALLVVGFFNVLRGILNSVIQPSLQAVVEHIRRGTLDFVLMKPADAQFLVSTARFEVREVTDSLAGVGIIAYALSRLGEWPGPLGVAAAVLIVGCGVMILYSIFILVVGLAFVWVKVDNLSYLFMSLFDAARWPASVFRGAMAWVFTFILPLAVMTTFPALAVMNRLTPAALAQALLVTAVFLTLSRVAWLQCLRRYTSAGG